MNELPQGDYVGELYCFAVGLPRDGRFAFIPAAPSVAIEQDTAKASLLSSPAGAVIALEAVWQADEAAIDAASAAIASRYPEAGDIDLRPADLSDVTASLTVEDADGRSHVTGPHPASGTSSHRVAFSETLTAAEKLAAISAFHGKAGVLTLHYAGRLSLNESAAVEIAGDLANAVKALAPKPVEEQSGGFFSRKKEPPPVVPPTIADCASALDDAIASGLLKVFDASTPNVSPQASQKAADELRAKLAKMLLDKLQQMGADAIYLSSFPVKLKTATPESAAFEVTRSADLGAWLAQHGGGQLVAEAAAAIPEPSR